jgi:aminobenzoyl-glutamate utilization protein B
MLPLSRSIALILAADLLMVQPALAADEPSSTRKEDVIYGRKYGTALTLDVFRPTGDASGAAVIMVVSGGFFSSHEAVNPTFIRPLLVRGYTVFAVVHGSQPRYTVPEIVGDMRRAVRFVRHHAQDYGIDPGRIGITGASAGGHLSLMLSTAGDMGDPNARDPVDRESSRVQAVACFFPPTDFLNFGEPGRELIHARDHGKPFRPAFDYRELDAESNLWVTVTDEGRLRQIARDISPISHVSRDDPPTLILHGDRDELVPLQQSRILVEKLKGVGVETKLVVKEGAEHGWPEIGKDMELFADWFDAHLKKSAGPVHGASSPESKVDQPPRQVDEGASLKLVANGTSEPAQDYKPQVLADVEALKKQSQVMNDMVFSFGELGFQELETSKYLTGILEREGFTIERGIAGIPTAWMATFGSGKPVISLGSDIDCIPKASQKPGVARHQPLVEGAPGHGEGHNSGQPLNITAAIVVKRLMERAHLPGTLKLWPGVAEELLGTKAYFVRAGYFKGVDVVLFTHVGNNLGVSWGAADGTGLVSVEYTFKGESAHAGSAPWRGRSALDAVELMNAGWNFRREHLRTQQRSHYVITGGGDQPNVVPSLASVWYYFRELDYAHIKELREIGDSIAQGAALMTNTSVTSRVLGTAWPQHFNKPLAEAMYENIKQVGLPAWSEADQALAKAVQRELKVPERGLDTKLSPLDGPVSGERMTRGGSDDIGDISWNVPTVTLRYPSNIPNLPGHHWSNAITMATPIAHQGVTAGAKVLAMTMVDLLTKPALVHQARDYFRDVQTKETKYQPLISAQDKPAIWLNRKTMDEFREPMRKFHFNPAEYDTYLDQLGIRYPDVLGAPPETR